MGLEEPLIVMGNGKVKSCLPSISILKEGGGTGGGGEGLPPPFTPPPLFLFFLSPSPSPSPGPPPLGYHPTLHLAM